MRIVKCHISQRPNKCRLTKCILNDDLFVLSIALAPFKRHNSVNWNNKRAFYNSIYTNKWIISAIVLVGRIFPLKCSVPNIVVLLFVFVHKQYNILLSFYCLHESEKMITTKWNESSFATSTEKNRRYDT